MDYKEKVIALLNSQELSKEQKEMLETIFPELKESEDERIRKGIIRNLEYLMDRAEGFVKDELKERIAWLEKQGEQPNRVSIWKHWNNGIAGNGEGKIVYLIKNGSTYSLSSCLGFECDYIELSDLDKLYVEKQGEQKPADKIEPKFHEGDWVVRNGKTLQISHIDEVLDGTFHYWFTVGTWLSSAKMEDAHLWTVQDAKDGDVLCTYECDKPKIVFILKVTPKKHYALSYHCYYNIMYPHFESDSVKGCLAPNDEDVKPATKEQRDQLEKAMADAGYTFDFEKKELKKIEPKPADTEKGAKGNEREIPNSAWSEEDEDIINHLFAICSGAKRYRQFAGCSQDDVVKYQTWLVSLKERVQPQLKQE